MRDDYLVKVIGDVCKVIPGQSPKSKYYNVEGLGLPFYQGKKRFTDKFLDTPVKWTTHISKEAVEGDILMSVRAPVGPVNFATEKICIGRGLAAIRAYNDIDRNYLFYFFLKNEADLESTRGAVFDSINSKQIRNIEVPVPSLPEQKRIVAILDKAFAAIDQAQANIERNIENAEELFQSKLEAVFSERGEGWEEKKLGEACKISMGQSPKGSTYNYERIGTPLINGPVEFGPYPFSETVMAKWTTEPKKMCKKGDLILCVRGSTTGRINIAGFEACIGRGVALIRYDKNQKWLNFFIRAKQDYIYSLGSGSTFPNVSGKILNEIEFPEPPIEVQNSLIEVMDNLVENTNQILLVFKTKLQNINELKKSLLQNAFSGELTEKDGVA